MWYEQLRCPGFIVLKSERKYSKNSKFDLVPGNRSMKLQPQTTPLGSCSIPLLVCCFFNVHVSHGSCGAEGAPSPTVGTKKVSVEHDSAPITEKVNTYTNTHLAWPTREKPTYICISVCFAWDCGGCWYGFTATKREIQPCCILYCEIE